MKLEQYIKTPEFRKLSTEEKVKDVSKKYGFEPNRVKSDLEGKEIDLIAFDIKYLNREQL